MEGVGSKLAKMKEKQKHLNAYLFLEGCHFADKKKRWRPPSSEASYLLGLGCLACVALAWLGLACLSAWLALPWPSNNNSRGAKRRHPPKAGGLLLLLGKASQAERQARPSRGKASQASQAKATLNLPSSGLPAWLVIVNLSLIHI